MGGLPGAAPSTCAGPAAPEQPPPAWVTPTFVALGVGLVPWTVVLALTLPAHHGTRRYDVAWTGFDAALAAALLSTAVGAAKRATWLQGSAAVAATLLVCDAWFDILSATSTGELFAASALAALVELPVAAACIFVSRYSEEAADRARRLATISSRRAALARRRHSV